MIDINVFLENAKKNRENYEKNYSSEDCANHIDSIIKLLIHAKEKVHLISKSSNSKKSKLSTNAKKFVMDIAKKADEELI